MSVWWEFRQILGKELLVKKCSEFPSHANIICCHQMRVSHGRPRIHVMVEGISDAVADTAPTVREMMDSLAGFRDTGKRMLAAWSEGVNSLRDSRMYSLSPWKSHPAFEGVSDPPKLENPRRSLGGQNSSLNLGKRRPNEAEK